MSDSLCPLATSMSSSVALGLSDSNSEEHVHDHERLGSRSEKLLLH